MSGTRPIFVGKTPSTRHLECVEPSPDAEASPFQLADQEGKYFEGRIQVPEEEDTLRVNSNSGARISGFGNQGFMGVVEAPDDSDEDDSDFENDNVKTVTPETQDEKSTPDSRLETENPG